VSFEVREEAVGIGQKDATAKYGIGESVGRSGEIVEDDYGIAVLPESFTDIVSGVDPSKFSARIGEEVLRRGFGYGVTGPKQARSSNRLARVSEDEEDGDGDDMDEEAMEALDLSEGQGIVRGRNGRPPTKVTTVWRKLEVLAEVSYVPFEGRVDAKAARQSVRALQPREIIVLGGPSVDADETLHDEVGLLAQAAQSYAIGGNPVLTPSDGETAELNIGHAAYAVRLVDTPFVPLAERQVGTSLPDPVELYEVKLGPCTISKVDYVATGQKVAADGSIVLAPKSSSADAIPSIYLSSGEVLLTDLRAELIAQGMKAEYKTRQGYSQLIVNGHIVVKKEQSSGQMEVEGPLCEDFWTVRQVVCSQFVSL
jgi:cleavage and polyadenylation specificity factor subunit 2